MHLGKWENLCYITKHSQYQFYLASPYKSYIVEFTSSCSCWTLWRKTWPYIASFNNIYQSISQQPSVSLFRGRLWNFPSKLITRPGVSLNPLLMGIFETYAIKLEAKTELYRTRSTVWDVSLSGFGLTFRKLDYGFKVWRSLG